MTRASRPPPRLASSAMQLRSRPGRRLVAGRYLLMEELGRGATGVVHRARDLRDGRYVAAKVLRGGDVEAVVRFVHESAHRIAHPHVATPLGWAAEDDTVLIVMPLARGGSVRDLLAAHGPLPGPDRGPAPRAAAGRAGGGARARPGARRRQAGQPAARTLAARPTPTAAGRLRGRDQLPPRPPGGVSGTPAFLPPERLAGAPAHPSQDVYAAGLVARRAMAGPSPLLTLCDSLTRADPERRPTAAAALRRLRELTGPS